MSPSVAACAACGHVFGEQEALDPCPVCGGTERALRREDLVVEPTASGVERRRQIEEQRPDGSLDIVEDPLT